MIRRVVVWIVLMGCWAGMVRGAGVESVERWGIFEVALKGPAEGNPFAEVQVSAHFSHGATAVDVAGFYDGEGVYRVRFSPPEEGEWVYTTKSNVEALDGKMGRVQVGPPTGVNHGQVGVKNVFHFAYGDGKPYWELGTTCYYWAMQEDALQAQTLATLKAGPFNKVRMFLMPVAGAGGPALYPFMGNPPKGWDFTRFDPAYFRRFEKCVAGLRDLGIEADVILFNVYDKGRWGYDGTKAPEDERYLRYAIARLGAYRNVWWSLANEFDLGKTKTDADWDRYFQVVEGADPYHHLRSIHHSARLYDYTKSWVTHASLQNGSAVEDFGRAELYRDVYRKPIVLDEVKYEGDIDRRWGQLSAEEMVARFWQGTIAGVYVGHSEAFKEPKGSAWMDKGGVLRGQSAARIGFLRSILEASPGDGIDPIDKWQDVHTAGVAGSFYLVYFGKEEPTEWVFELPKAGLKAGMKFKVDVIDTWGMTVSPVSGVFEVIANGKYRYNAQGMATVSLPGRKYMALRITQAP